MRLARLMVRDGPPLERSTFERMLREAVAAAVQQVMDRVVACERCGTLFVKSHRQTYCTTTCRAARYVSKRPPRDYRKEREAAQRKGAH